MSTGRETVVTGSANAALADASLTACPSCDLVQRLPEITPGQSARCPRCGTELRHGRQDSLNRTLALTVAAAVLYLIANTVPMLGLNTLGRASSTTVVGGALKLWESGQEPVAVLVFFAAVLAPAFQIGFYLVVLFASQFKRPPAWVAVMLRHLPFTATWSMIGVMLLGVLVALTKIAEYATVVPGGALFALGGLVVILAAMQTCFDPQEVWKRVNWTTRDARTPVPGLAREETNQ